MNADINVSDAPNENPQFTRATRRKGENNLGWLERQLKGYGRVAIVLAGGSDNLSCRLRVAQAHLRFSFTPSHWSHCFLLLHGTRDGLAYEISLQPPGGFGFAGATNAMQEAPLSSYESVERWPNMAVIRVDSIDPQQAAETLLHFGKQRAIVDAVSLLIRWLAYAWGAGNSGNPVLEGIGLPSAAMIEAVCNACGYDISPITPSRSSTPEALWQSTKWWHHAPRTTKAASIERGENELPADLPTGKFIIGHELGDQREGVWSAALQEK
jgi:hypothetical protein